jgi:hypothetical protein
MFRTLPAFVLLALVSSCAAPPAPRLLSSAFYGTWTNVVAGYQNWWEIGPNGVKNYGTALANGTCTVEEVVVLDADHIDIRFGNSGVVHLYLDERSSLVLERNGRSAVHKRIAPAEICRTDDGKYSPGAPFPS